MQKNSKKTKYRNINSTKQKSKKTKIYILQKKYNSKQNYKIHYFYLL